MARLPENLADETMGEQHVATPRPRLSNSWAFSLYTAAVTLLGFGALLLMVQSFLTRQVDTKGCEMSYMRPAFFRFQDFDTEHTRFATKYSLYLYREGGIDDDARVPSPTPIISFLY